jgi:hypothetical protein
MDPPVGRQRSPDSAGRGLRGCAKLAANYPKGGAVSVVIFFTVKGDSQELLAAYDKTVAPPHPSRLGHLMAPTNDGMTGVEVWTSQEDLERYLADDLPAIFERAGVMDVIPPNASGEIAPVHHAEGRLTQEP